jgi:heptosyltransferase-1
MERPIEPSRILLIRPSALGDVCRTVPVLVSLRRAWPSARIDWLVQRGFEEAIAAHPDLNRTIQFDRKRLAIKRLWTSDARCGLRELLGELRLGRYDLVLDCQGLGRSGLFSWLTGAPIRVGHRDARELAWLGYTRRVSSPTDRHTVDRMLDLVRGLDVPVVPDMRLYPGPAAEAWADQALGPAAGGPRTVALAPTSRWEGKRWPIERFAELARHLLGDARRPALAERIVVVGSHSERPQCGPLLEMAGGDPRIVDLVGRSSVGQLMAVIGRSALVVANDSAALHMAVGLGRPLVGLFGPTRVELVGPYGRSEDVIQARPPEPGVSHKNEPAGRAMMELIGLETVFERCRAQLER